ncbi:MAG: hypothetical protein M3Q34_02710 [bacterium]|nr:hypothetical protein [bacterium]
MRKTVSFLIAFPGTLLGHRITFRIYPVPCTSRHNLLQPCRKFFSILSIMRTLLSLVFFLSASQISFSQVSYATTSNFTQKIVIGLCVATPLLFFILYPLFWSKKARDRRRSNQQRREKEKIKEILFKFSQGYPVHKAGPPQVYGGVHLNAARFRLAGIAGVEWHEILWFVPVKIIFLRDVQVGFNSHLSVPVKPANETDSIYYVGQTRDGNFVLCDCQSGDQIFGVSNAPIYYGIHFRVTGIVKLPEVLAYQALNYLMENFHITNQLDLELH